jgi:hypothetical protein
MTVLFAGDSEQDRKYWNTYVYWLQSKFGRTNIPPDKSPRHDDEYSNSLQIILFTAFALEYRLRRVLSCFRVTLRKNTTLSQLLKIFWRRLEGLDRLDNTGKCVEPVEWNGVKSKLEKLLSYRNAIVHANYDYMLENMKQGVLLAEAKELHNIFIDAMRIINIATGYSRGTEQEVREYFDQLKVQ